MRAIGRVGHVDHVRARVVEQGRARQQFVSRESARRIHFHRDANLPEASFCANCVGGSTSEVSDVSRTSDIWRIAGD